MAIITTASPATDAASQRRNMARWLGAERIGQNRQPLGGGGGLVVDDVEDTRRSLSTREHGRASSVLEVDERGDPRAVPTIG